MIVLRFGELSYVGWSKMESQYHHHYYTYASPINVCPIYVREQWPSGKVLEGESKFMQNLKGL